MKWRGRRQSSRVTNSVDAAKEKVRGYRNMDDGAKDTAGRVTDMEIDYAQDLRSKYHVGRVATKGKYSK